MAFDFKKTKQTNNFTHAAQSVDFRVTAPTDIDFDSVHAFVLEAAFVELVDVLMRWLMQMLETPESS